MMAELISIFDKTSMMQRTKSEAEFTMANVKTIPSILSLMIISVKWAFEAKGVIEVYRSCSHRTRKSSLLEYILCG